MDWEDVRAKPAMVTIGDNLETLSVSELESRIVALQAEIERVNGELAKKRAHEAAAAAIFRR